MKASYKLEGKYDCVMGKSNGTREKWYFEDEVPSSHISFPNISQATLVPSRQGIVDPSSPSVWSTKRSRSWFPLPFPFPVY
ncbi:uncharacterized protein G2W53_037152 [Senna tora]|uniref:Uncharacterized protein n=1 Tax=Senna tora TaxID=362788 RepID=A0A834WAV5_9FABA|nr:uncharacterized protein G2W53_037152 [Senna tora]